MNNLNTKETIYKKRAFTLLELLIYISVFSIVVVVVSNTFISLSKGQGQSSAKNEVDSAVRFATELLRQDIKNASIVSVPALAGDTSSTLTLTREGVTILYDVSGGILRRTEGSGSPLDITNSSITVGTPVFTRLENTNSVFNANSVVISINMVFDYNSTSPDWQYSTSLQTAVSLYSYN